MERGSVFGRTSAAERRLSAPRSLRVASVAPAGVTLRWSAARGPKPAHYVILRDGKSLGKTTRTTYTDTKVKPGKTYRYSVRAYDKGNRAGALSQSVRVKIPRQAASKLPSPTTNPVTDLAPVTQTPAPGSTTPPPPDPTAS